MTEVTVLMPVYNGENYLRPAIESILSQTYRDFELLIIDDGSSDGSASIIRSYTDKRIRLLKNPTRLKLSGALNRGIGEARGNLIARMDADDIARPERLARQVEFLHKNPEIGVCGAWVKRFGSVRATVDKNPTDSEEIRAYALFECPFSHPTVMFRKNFFAEHNLRYNGDYYPAEDYEIWSRAVQLFPCANLPEVLLDYRVHSAGMTGAEWNDMDAQGAKIGQSNLERMGLHPTKQEIWLHRNVGRAGSRRCKDFYELEMAENWLKKLCQTNERHRTYDRDAFKAVLDLVWFRVCFNATPLGFKVLTRFHRGGRTGYSRKFFQRVSFMFLSVLKYKFVHQ